MHHRWCRWKEVLVSIQRLLVPPHRPPGFPRSIVVHSVHPASGQGIGGRIGTRHDIDDCVLDFREFLQMYPSRFSNVIRRG